MAAHQKFMKEIKVKIIPISQRAKSRVKEHGEYMIMFPDRTRNGKQLFRSINKTWQKEYWLGWFEIDKDIKISEDGESG